MHFSDESVSASTIHWKEVESVSVFKRDLGSFDLLCLAVETSDCVFEVDEEMDGWESLIASLPDFLPGAAQKQEWWKKVVLPPFATNWTLLYPRLRQENEE